MTYKQALRYLYSFVSYERKTNWTYSNKTLNLDRFRLFLEKLGNPQFGFPSIHAAGSDGKGSVCAMTASVLRSMGFKVGVFSSPHLHDIRERIIINGEWISKQAFSRLTRRLQEIGEQEAPLPQGYVTFFELLTAMAFLYFQEEQVDFAVVETGMGGRLDSTNVMRPKLSVITHISLEHTEQLGNTLEAIADEKLGITQPDIPVIIGRQEKNLTAHFHRRLKNHRAPVVFVDEQYRISASRCGRKYRQLDIERTSEPLRQRRIHIPLFGHYQMENAATVLAAIDALHENGVIPPPSPTALDRGFRRVIWPGRFEVFRRKDRSILVLDAAHTAKGAASLRLSLDEQFPRKKRVFLLGFLQGKKISDMIRSLARSGDAMIFTQAPTPRGSSLDMIRECLSGIDTTNMETYFIQTPARALAQAEKIAAPKDVLCATGSLYLVGEIRRRILDAPK
ncbi:MAG: bifunctional folylpolyglutamate synthase/dihydrofolate synthase [Candidatus Omnitrophica bacterium]|nr:bifunctional folylpolyglutamate synthase/dihydrofolate synthase [Candidatus Omnitrophota bacterium]